MRDNPGLSLIEVLLVTALITLVVGALVHLGIMSLRTADQSKKEGIATELTREVLETARVQRDSDTQTLFDNLVGVSGNGYYVLNSNTFSFVSVSEPTIPDANFAVSGHDGFYRVVNFELTDINTLSTWVKTYWQQASGRWDNVRSGTVLTRWR